jgi:hypothetical protein
MSKRKSTSKKKKPSEQRFVMVKINGEEIRIDLEPEAEPKKVEPEIITQEEEVRGLAALFEMDDDEEPVAATTAAPTPLKRPVSQRTKNYRNKEVWDVLGNATGTPIDDGDLNDLLPKKRTATEYVAKGIGKSPKYGIEREWLSHGKGKSFWAPSVSGLPTAVGTIVTFRNSDGEHYIVRRDVDGWRIIAREVRKGTWKVNM